MNWPITIEEMAKRFPEFNNLKGCPQDPRYHAEGDVWTHTQMVHDQARELRQKFLLTESEESALIGSSWFHDISKPECTVHEEDGSITSKGHSLRGSKQARRSLYREGIVNFETREELCNLVLNHAVPLHFLECPEAKVIEPSQVCNLTLLSTLAEADVRGRFCEDRGQLIETCQLYYEFAKENNCLVHPWRFESSYARYDHFLNHRRENVTYQATDYTKFEVIILCGLAGSGKDTWIKKNWEGPVISLDAWRAKLNVKPTDDQGFVAQQALEEAKTFLRKQESFVWNATNITRERRTRLIHVCHEYNARVRLVYLEVPYKTILKRNQERPYEAQLPTKALEKMIDSLEVPSVYEAPRVEYCII